MPVGSSVSLPKPAVGQNTRKVEPNQGGRRCLLGKPKPAYCLERSAHEQT